MQDKIVGLMVPLLRVATGASGGVDRWRRLPFPESEKVSSRLPVVYSI